MEQKALRDAIPDFLKSWNQEFGSRYPITDRMMNEYYCNSKYVIEDLSYALYDKDTYVGLLLVKEANGILPKYEDAFFISLIHIDQNYRRKKLAKTMLTNLIDKMNFYKKRRIYLGSDMDCFYPGVFVDHNEKTHQAIVHLGFQKVYNSFNLWTDQTVKLDANLNVQCATSMAEKEQILDFIKENFSYRWYVDCLNHSPHNFIYLKEQEEVIGFVRITSCKDTYLVNGLNTYKRYHTLYAIGPLGIKESYQHKGYGKEIVQFALHHAFKNGASDCIVDWTGLIEFYKKCGFKEICDIFTLYEFQIKGETDL